jgi:hypothetical protein
MELGQGKDRSHLFLQVEAAIENLTQPHEEARQTGMIIQYHAISAYEYGGAISY